jgi:lipoate-protein ligase A
MECITNSSWRLLKIEYHDPKKNTAIDEDILIAVDKYIAPNTLRLWRNKNAVVIGRSQVIEDEVNMEACRIYGTSIVRRFTGGGAVYQDLGNLNWTVVIRRNSLLVKRIKGILEIFDIFGKPIVEAVKTFNLHAESESNCIRIDDKKVSGMAAYIKQKSILCHGTLLVGTNLHILSKVLKHQKAKVTTLQQEIGEEISMPYVKNIILKAFNKIFNINLELGKSIWKG